MSIIDMALTNPNLDLLYVSEIPEEYLSLFYHEFFLLKWENIEKKNSEIQ